MWESWMEQVERLNVPYLVMMGMLQGDYGACFQLEYSRQLNLRDLEKVQGEHVNDLSFLMRSP